MKFIVFFIPILFVSCATRPPIPPTPSHRTPKSSAKVYKPTKEWVIKEVSDLDVLKNKIGATIYKQGPSYVVNMNGGVIDGSKQPGAGNQDENQAPLLRAKIPLIIKNGFIINNKDAATFYEPNSGVENLTWLTVGEDGVSTAEGAKNFRVINCEFINNRKGDKSIQLNEADGARIERNMIYAGITGVRIGKIAYSETANKAICSNNTFIGVDTAFNIAKVQLTVERPNTYKNVRIPFKITNGSSVKNADGKVETY